MGTDNTTWSDVFYETFIELKTIIPTGDYIQSAASMNWYISYTLLYVMVQFGLILVLYTVVDFFFILCLYNCRIRKLFSRQF